MPCGRRPNINNDIIIKTLLKYKNDIFMNNKVVSKNSVIWEIISKELSNYGHIKAKSFYSFVVCNNYNLHHLLNIKISKTLCNNIERNHIQLVNSSDHVSNITNKKIFTLKLTQEEYKSLLITKIYNGRTWKRFTSGKWADIIAQKIYNKHIQCGINFKGHYLSQSGDYGRIDGKCRCGSIFRGILKYYNNYIKINCTLTFGSNQCKIQNLKDIHQNKIKSIKEIKEEKERIEKEKLQISNQKRKRHTTNFNKYIDSDESEKENINTNKIQIKNIIPKSKQNIPILKNGNYLQKIKLKEKSVKIINTCAYDSLCQSLLIVYYNMEHIRIFIEERAVYVPIFKMIIDIFKTGITSETYRLRAEILSNIFTNVQGKMNIINCYCSVGYVTNKTMINCPSIEQEIFCANGCTKKRNIINTLLLEDTTLLERSFDDAIENYLNLTSKISKNCQICFSSTADKVTAAGPLIFIETYNIDGREKYFRLKDLPTQFKLLIDKEINIYILSGVINYKGPHQIKSHENSSGHFTTLCFHYEKKTWIEYDDMRNEEIIKPDTFKSNPQLLLYVLNKL